jgi:hypothetical protein
MSTKHQGRVTLTGVEAVQAMRDRESVKYYSELAVRRLYGLKWLADHDADDSWRKYQVQEHLADSKSGNLELSHWDVPRDDPARLWYMIEGGEDRDPGYGRFVKLTDPRLDQGPWMSDTRAEIMEHMPYLKRLAKLQSVQVQPTVLITGLGLGMAVRAALLHGASQVDVIELDADVVVLSGAQFADDPRVTIHQGNAFTAPLPRAERWDVAWHDIWPTIDDRNLPEMAHLMGRYPARWTGAWQEAGCRYMARILRLKAEYEAVMGPIAEEDGAITPGYLRPGFDRFMVEEGNIPLGQAKAEAGD